MGNIRFCFALTVLATWMGAASAAEVVVDPTLPSDAKPRFFERIQAPELARLIASRGHAQNVKPGAYHFRVPCDFLPAEEFADITFVIPDSGVTTLHFLQCGANFTTTP